MEIATPSDSLRLPSPLSSLSHSGERGIRKDAITGLAAFFDNFAGSFQRQFSFIGVEPIISRKVEQDKQ